MECCTDSPKESSQPSATASEVGTPERPNAALATSEDDWAVAVHATCKRYAELWDRLNPVKTVNSSTLRLTADLWDLRDSIIQSIRRAHPNFSNLSIDVALRNMLDHRYHVVHVPEEDSDEEEATFEKLGQMTLLASILHR